MSKWLMTRQDDIEQLSKIHYVWYPSFPDRPNYNWPLLRPTCRLLIPYAFQNWNNNLFHFLQAEFWVLNWFPPCDILLLNVSHIKINTINRQSPRINGKSFSPSSENLALLSYFPLQGSYLLVSFESFGFQILVSRKLPIFSTIVHVLFYSHGLWILTCKTYHNILCESV